MDDAKTGKPPKFQKGYYLPRLLVDAVSHAAIDSHVKENVFVERALRRALEEAGAADGRLAS